MELQMPELQKNSVCVWLTLNSDKKADGCFDLLCFVMITV